VEDALRDMWRTIAVSAPKILLFILILIVGWIVAKLIAKAIDKILERVGFDRAVERGGIRRALQNSRYDASTIVSKIVYYALLLFVLQLAFGVFGPNPVSALLSGVIAFLPKLFVAIIIVVVAAAIAAAVKDIVANSLSGLSYGRMVGNIASIAILGLGVIAALNQVGIALTVTLPVLIAILGTVGGILIVGVGGGLIKPMQHRWEDYLSRAENEGRNMRERMSANTGDLPPYQHAGGQPPAGQIPPAGQVPTAGHGPTSGPYPSTQQGPPPTAPYPQQQQPYPPSRPLG
jgi:Conserved TM helix